MAVSCTRTLSFIDCRGSRPLLLFSADGNILSASSAVVLHPGVISVNKSVDMSASFSWCASGSRLLTGWEHEGLRIIERYVTLCHHLTGHWRSCCQDPHPPSLTPISPTSHVFFGVGKAHLALFVCCNVCHVQDVAAARCLSCSGTVPPVLRAVTMQSQPCVCIGLMNLVLGGSGWCCHVVLCYVYRRSLSFPQVAVRCERGKGGVCMCVHGV